MNYSERIIKRNFLRFVIGLIPRTKNYLYYSLARMIARKKGAIIGVDCVLKLSLACKANKNLRIGNCSSIQTDCIDLRNSVTIGNNVIIGQDVDIITTSHSIDSEYWEHSNYGLVIEDYVWLATKVMVLPSCRKIGYGSVCGAGSVVVRNVSEMSVVGGNPATVFKNRKNVHSKLVVESLLGGDLKRYISVWRCDKNYVENKM